jgi:hypothetical protein
MRSAVRSDAAEAPQPGAPSREQRRGAASHFSNQPVGRLTRGHGRCVEPPPDVAELALHFCLEPFVPIEVALCLLGASGVAVLAHLDPRSENDKPDWTRRHQRDEEVQL